MDQVTFRVFPPEGAVFAATAFDNVIGTTVVKVGDHPGILTGAVIAEGGAYAEITIEATGPPPGCLPVTRQE